MWGIFFLGIAIGISFCEFCESISKRTLKKIKIMEDELLLIEINKLKEQVEKSN